MHSSHTFLVIPSGDPTAIGNNSEWILPNVGMNLDPKKEYEVCLVDCSFGHPGPTNNSVYIFMDILENTFIGSDRFPLLYKTRPMGNPSEPLYYENQTSSVVQYHRLMKKDINSIKTTIQQSTGEPIDDTQFSTVTIGIREVE